MSFKIAAAFRSFNVFSTSMQGFQELGDTPGMVVDEMDFDQESLLKPFNVVDPEGTQWERHGLRPWGKTEQYLKIVGGAYFFLIETRKRILPSQVIMRRKAELIELEERREGMKLGKVAKAQITEEALMELLPKAFIRSSVTGVMVVDGMLFIGAASLRRCDDVINVLHTVFEAFDTPIEMSPYPFGNVRPWFKELIEGDDSGTFAVGSAGRLESLNKQKVSIANKDMHGTDVQSLLNTAGQEEMATVELELIQRSDPEDAESVVTRFKFDERHAFKKTRIAGDQVIDSEEEELSTADAFLFIASRTMPKLVKDIEKAIDAADDEL